MVVSLGVLVVLADVLAGVPAVVLAGVPAVNSARDLQGSKDLRCSGVRPYW